MEEAWVSGKGSNVKIRGRGYKEGLEEEGGGKGEGRGHRQGKKLTGYGRTEDYKGRNQVEITEKEEGRRKGVRRDREIDREGKRRKRKKSIQSGKNKGIVDSRRGTKRGREGAGKGDAARYGRRRRE